MFRHGNWFVATEPEEEMLPYVMSASARTKFSSPPTIRTGMACFPTPSRRLEDISDTDKEHVLRKNAQCFYGWE